MHSTSNTYDHFVTEHLYPRLEKSWGYRTISPETFTYSFLDAVDTLYEVLCNSRNRRDCPYKDVREQRNSSHCSLSTTVSRSVEYRRQRRPGVSHSWNISKLISSNVIRACNDRHLSIYPEAVYNVVALLLLKLALFNEIFPNCTIFNQFIMFLDYFLCHLNNPFV